MSYLPTVNAKGTLAARPAAAAANEGYNYFATDGSGTLYRSNGTSWDTIASVGLADQGTVTFLDFTTAAAPANPAAGKIRVYSKTGDTLSQRTSGGVETVFGAGGGGAGALVLLESRTASASATLDFTTRNAAGQSGDTFQSDFDAYVIEIFDLLPATNATGLAFQFRTASGFMAGTDYKTGGWAFVYNGSALFGGSGFTKGVFANLNDISNVAGDGVVGTIKCFSPASAVAVKKYKFDIGWMTSNIPKTATGLGAYVNTTAVNGFRFLFTSGNIASGTVRVYGIAT